MKAIRIPIIYEEDTSALAQAAAEIQKVTTATQEYAKLKAKAFAENAEAIKWAATQTQLLGQAQANLNKVSALEARLISSKKGSYNALNAELALIKLRLDQMTAAEIKNTKEGKALTAQTAKLKEQLKALKDEQAPLNNALEGTAQNLGEMRKELLALRNTSFSGKTQAEIDAINQRIGELTDGITDLRAIQNEFGNEFGSQIAGSLQVITAGVEGVVGALNILGIESETLGGLQKNIVDLIAVTQALGAIEDALAKGTLKATATRIAAAAATVRDTIVKWANVVSTQAAAKAEDAKTVAMARGSLATRAAAAVQYIWNAALAANPIGIVVVAVAALAAGVIYLTRVMGESADATERLNNELERTQEISERNERLRKFEVALAQERKKTGSELTALEIKQTNDRIAEREKEIAILRKFGDLTEEQGEKYKALTFELIDLDKERILLSERLKVQLADEAADRAKEAEKRAKEAKAERERLSREREASRKERQAAYLRELEAQKQFDLARLDAQRDYGNNSIKYQNDFAATRLATEQAAQIEILKKQLEFGQITQKEFDAQLEQLKASAAKFIAELPTTFDQAAVSVKNAVNAALAGDDGIEPLESIFKINSKKDFQAKVDKLLKEEGEAIKTEVTKQRSALKRFFADGESILDILGISEKNQGFVKSQLDAAYANILSGLATIYDTQIAQESRVIDARKQRIGELQSLLNDERKLKEQGVANDYDLYQRQLNEQTELLKKEEEKRLALEKKAASIRLKQEALETASNIILSVAKVTAAESNKGLLGVITAISAVASIFTLVAKAKAQALQLSAPPKLRQGGDLAELFSGEVKGATHENGGVRAWMRQQAIPIELEGREFVMPVQPAQEHGQFLESMRKGEFKAVDLTKYVNTGKEYHENPAGFFKDAPLDFLNVQPYDYLADMLPTIRNTMNESLKLAAIEKGEQAKEIAALRGEIGTMQHVLKTAIEGIPIAIPLAENTTGYMIKSKLGNTISVNIYDPPKRKGKKK